MKISYKVLSENVFIFYFIFFIIIVVTTQDVKM